MDNVKREFEQLFFIADFYFELSKTEKENLTEEEINRSIHDWSLICENETNYKKIGPFLFFSAHLSSCAIRLYSIDETMRSDRWQSYENIKI